MVMMDGTFPGNQNGSSMPNYGVIDLGSNSIRLVVYEVRDNRKRAYTNRDFKSLINDKVMAGLSAYVQEGLFTQAGIERAASVLKGHAKRARYFRCERIDVFATAVLRNCRNSAAAICAIEQNCGMRINLLSAKDEAHLGFCGATCDRSIERGTLMDIGGGSTELTRINGNADSHNTSIPQGSLSSYANHVERVLPAESEIDAIEQAMHARMQSLPDLRAFQAKRLYGIGGSVRAVAKMLAQMRNSETRPKEFSLADADELLALLRQRPSEFAHLAAKAVPERIHTLVPGCVIAKTVMETCGAETLEICKYGIREGYLIERMLL